jgi:hypothetical protein
MGLPSFLVFTAKHSMQTEDSGFFTVQHQHPLSFAQAQMVRHGQAQQA